MACPCDSCWILFVSILNLVIPVLLPLSAFIAFDMDAQCPDLLPPRSGAMYLVGCRVQVTVSMIPRKIKPEIMP
jgi:hypothetical protein